MRVNRLIEVRGASPLAALQEFLGAWWQMNGVTAILAPVESGAGAEVAVQAIESPTQLGGVNPFAPVMSSNAAGAIMAFARDHAGGRLAVLLRPCEMRSLVEMRKRRRTTPEADAILVLSVDCLASYPAGEYDRRVASLGAGGVWREALEYADQGGFTPQRLRRACQACDSPVTHDADVSIGLFGVDPSRHLLAVARDEATDARLHLERMTHGLASEDLLARREMAIGTVAERRSRRRDQMLGEGARSRGGVAEVLSLLASCSLCGDCLDACPLYNGELAGMLGVRSGKLGGRSLLAELVELGRWLSSCSGCGMCEEVCASGVPLLELISPLSFRVREQTRYRPGNPAEPVAWLLG